MFSPLEQFDVIKLVSIYGFEFKSLFSLFINFTWDFSFTNVLIPILIIICFSLIVVRSLRKDLYLVPTALQRVFELIVEFVFSIVKQQIGKEGYLLFPLIFTLFNFILFSNLLSLLPFGIALTSHLILMLWLALSICLSIFILGLSIHKFQFFKIFIPECPFILLPMLILIELFSYVIRAFSLAIRLSANIMAGHTLVYIIASSVVYITSVKLLFFAFGFMILFLILLLELGVAFLQAYVFTILVCIYTNDAINLSH